MFRLEAAVYRPRAMHQRHVWEDEATSRAISAQPWEPLPGMEKRQCPECRYFFAAESASGEPRCPDCVAFGSKPVSADPP